VVAGPDGLLGGVGGGQVEDGRPDDRVPGCTFSGADFRFL
jgi:hypothetical protein